MHLTGSLIVCLIGNSMFNVMSHNMEPESGKKGVLGNAFASGMRKVARADKNKK